MNFRFCLANLERLTKLLVIVTMFGSAAVSQTTTITKGEFDNAWQAAFATSRNKAVQIAMDTEVKNDGNIISIERSVNQFVAPDRIRSLIVVSSGAKTWKDETVEIGDAAYRKKDNGKWLQYPATERVRRVAVPSNLLPANWSESPELKFYITDSILDGKPARVYSAERNGNSTYNHAEQTSVWISAEGLILKTESLNREINKSDTWIMRTVSVWSYDPFAFEIETPIK